MAHVLIATVTLLVSIFVYKVFCHIAPRFKYPSAALTIFLGILAFAYSIASTQSPKLMASHSADGEQNTTDGVPTSTTTALTGTNSRVQQSTSSNDACESSSDQVVKPPLRFRGKDRVANSVLVAEALVGQVDDIRAAILISETDTMSGAMAAPLAGLLCAPILLVPSAEAQYSDDRNQSNRSEGVFRFLTNNLHLPTSGSCSGDGDFNLSPTAKDIGEAKIVMIGPLAGFTSEWSEWVNNNCHAIVQVWHHNHASTSAHLASHLNEIRFGKKAQPVCGFAPEDVFFTGSEIDALMVAPLAYRVGIPILLDRASEKRSSDNEDVQLNPDIKQFLKERSKIPVGHVWIIGGHKSVSNALMAEIEDAVPSRESQAWSSAGNASSVTRIFGVDRFRTADELAQFGVSGECESSEFIGIARVASSSIADMTLEHAPDAPSAAVYLGEIGAYLFLIEDVETGGEFDCEDLELLLDLRRSVSSDAERQVVTFGGTAAIDVALRDWYRAAWIDGTLPAVCVSTMP